MGSKDGVAESWNDDWQFEPDQAMMKSVALSRCSSSGMILYDRQSIENNLTGLSLAAVDLFSLRLLTSYQTRGPGDLDSLGEKVRLCKCQLYKKIFYIRRWPI